MEIDVELTMDEIKARFDQEWVLINEPKEDERLRVLSGRVRFHSPDRDEFDAAVKCLRSDHIAVRFIGDPPENMQFML